MNPKIKRRLRWNPSSRGKKVPPHGNQTKITRKSAANTAFVCSFFVNSRHPGLDIKINQYPEKSMQAGRKTPDSMRIVSASELWKSQTFHNCVPAFSAGTHFLLERNAWLFSLRSGNNAVFFFPVGTNFPGWNHADIFQRRISVDPGQFKAVFTKMFSIIAPQTHGTDGII